MLIMPDGTKIGKLAKRPSEDQGEKLVQPDGLIASTYTPDSEPYYSPEVIARHAEIMKKMREREL